MKTRYLLVAALIAFAGPLHAQVTPDSVRVELVRSRGFIRAAETQLSKTLALLDSLIGAGAVDTTGAEPAPPSDTIPPPAPPEPPSDTVPSPPLGETRRNLPAGWSIISDYGFEGPVPTQTGYYEGQPLGGGWLAQDWDFAGATELQRVSDPSAIGSPPYVLAETYPPHLGGGGTTTFYRSIPVCRSLYLSWVVKWDAGFDHNSNSEKQTYFNFGDSNYFLFQFHWGTESIYNIAPAVKYWRDDAALSANLEPNGLDGQGLPIAPPIDGQWNEYEFLFEQATGRVRWWLNGVPHADHTGRTFPAVRHLKVSTTWGGGGDKQGTHKRYTDDILLACGG